MVKFSSWRFKVTYDQIGNLVHGAAEEIQEIKWTVYGKISEIIRTTASTKADLQFVYGPDGNRVTKIVKPRDNNKPWRYTFYVRDAQGNVMATYTRETNKRIPYEYITFGDINDKIIIDKGESEWRDFIKNTPEVNTLDCREDLLKNLFDNSQTENFLEAYTLGQLLVTDQVYPLSSIMGSIGNVTLSSCFRQYNGQTQFITDMCNYDKATLLDLLFNNSSGNLN